MILNDERFHRSGAFFVIVNGTIDTTAHGITPHQPSIVGRNNSDTAAMSFMPGSSQKS